VTEHFGPDYQVWAPPTTWQRPAATDSRRWMPLLVNGVLSLLIGGAALVWPRTSLLLIAVLFAITLLSNGVVQLVIAMVDNRSTVVRRLMLGALGPLSIMAGVLCLIDPEWTLGAIALLVGACWTISGVLTVVAALTDTAEGSRSWAAVRGLLNIFGGLVVLLLPAISLLTLTVAFGLLLITLGVLLMVDAGQLRARTQPA
jgi:uncharacterized membrane protein HdeD (DUF308 family)